MSINKSRSVRSAVAVVFALSTLFVWNHQHTAKTVPAQVAAASGPCYSMNGVWFCP